MTSGPGDAGDAGDSGGASSGPGGGGAGGAAASKAAVVLAVLLLLAPLVAGGMLTGLVVIVAVSAVSAISAQASTGCLPEGTVVPVTSPVAVSAAVLARREPGLAADPGVRAQQWAHAAAIVAQGARDRVPVRGLVIAVMTARQESSLLNVAHGDTAGPDSRGLFQQRAPWGPLQVRMDPAGAAHLFFTGGLTGQPGLLDIPGWQALSPGRAAQAVQRSAYPDRYARWQPMATAIVTTLLTAQLTAQTTPSPGSPAAAGDVPATVAVGQGDQLGGCDGAGVVGAQGWTLPVPAGSYTLSSPFGLRTLLGTTRMHQGQDFAVPVGTPVYAAAAGTVTYAGPASGYGNLVRVQHPGGITTLYGHLSVIRARPGPVTAGTVIGLSGGAPGAPGSGRSTGPHLHFQIELNGTPTDPVALLHARGVRL